MRPRFDVSDDPAGAAAALLAGAGGHVCLTGGSTPKKAYERAADARSDWSGVDFWFTDERCVPPDHEHSNFRMVNEALLAGAAGATVHRMKGELGPGAGSSDHEREYEAAGRPEFDLILLGIGPDVHICSLFPGDDALGERERAVVGVETPGMAPLLSRITFTLPVVNAAREIVFLVTGEDKAYAVARAFNGRPDPAAPASLVQGDVTVLLDEGAAGRL